MERYLIAYTDYDDYEGKKELVKVEKSKDGVLSIISAIATDNALKLVSVSKINFNSLKVIRLKVELNSDMKLELKEVEE